MDTARAPPVQVVWSWRAMEAKVVKKEKHFWRLDMFSLCLEKHELKEPVVQLKISFRSLRLVPDSALCLFLLHQIGRAHV